MEAVAARVEAPWERLLRRVDTEALSTWTLVGTIVLYLAIDGGGYDVIVHSQAGIVIWWIVLIGAVWGLLPTSMPSRAAWGGMALLGGFVAWTAIANTWSLSSERSLDQLSLVACYLGIFALAVAIHRDRERAVRHTVNALAAAIVVVSCLALISRLRPELIPAARQTSNFLHGTEERLSWPLNYWNALGALLALGLPLLLSVASSARTLLARAAAAAAIPLVVLTGYLTFSRGAALAAAVALVAFIALAPDRIPKLATALVAAAGSAALIGGAVHRPAIEHGLATAAARHESSSLIAAIIIVCCGVGLVQVAIGLAVRHGTPPRWLVVPVGRARVLLVGGVVACVVVAVAAGVPGDLAHAWRDFKHSTAPSLHDYSVSRFGTLSGNGRYDYWKAAADATNGHVLGGSGPGTFQLLWLPRAPYYSYIQNAHSLYVETLSEVGVVGLGLLVSFLGLVLGSAVRLVIRSRYEARTLAAGALAAAAAFAVSAGFDWIWQVPALPAAFLLLGGALMAPSGQRARSRRARAGSVGRLTSGGWLGRFSRDRGLVRFDRIVLVRLGAVVVAVACLVGIAIPLATTTSIRRSQAAATNGDPVGALADARAAARLEPGAATPQVQLALVLELQGQRRAALTPAKRAVRDEPDSWSAWLILSRLQAETRHPQASLQA